MNEKRKELEKEKRSILHNIAYLTEKLDEENIKLYDCIERIILLIESKQNNEEV
jgi:hypothetical protein